MPSGRGVRIKYLRDLERVHVDVERVVDEHADRFVLHRPFLGGVEWPDLYRRRVLLSKLMGPLPNVNRVLRMPRGGCGRFEHDGTRMAGAGNLSRCDVMQEARTRHLVNPFVVNQWHRLTGAG